MKRKNRISRYKKVTQNVRESSLSTYWAILRKLGSVHEFPRSDEFRLLCKKRDFIGLVELADCLSGTTYPDAYSHYVGNQFAHLIKKYPYPGVEKHFDPEGVAFRKFLSAEQRCSRYNRLFRLRRAFGRDKMSFDLSSMRGFIRYVIGDAPNLSEIWDECGFGPGASIGVHGDATNAGRKISSPRWTCSSSALSYFKAATMKNLFMRRAVMPAHEGFSSGLSCPLTGFYERIDITPYNKIEFVPKTVKTYRSIAVEPLGNGFVQKGVDQVLRKRLRRIRIDLSDQTLNQRMAREGSVESPDPFCTIDLSSASDSICIELVREVLPEDWFELLNNLRSKSFEYKGSKARYEKFCSMGNGFCFPLQSLIFAAVCHACGAGSPGTDFCVYGDDIIVRQSVAKKVLKLLRAIGFRENLDKTFLEGPFRESCGTDWFGGIDVRPYVWDDPLDSIQNHFKFLNLTQGRPLWEDFFLPVRDLVLNRLPLDYRLFRPFTGPVDSGIDSRDEFLTSRHCKYRGNGVWRWREMSAQPISDEKLWVERQDTQYALEWYAAFQSCEGSAPFALRRKTKTKMRWVSHPGATCKWLPPG